MPDDKKVPSQLYKFRKFSAQTIDLIVADKIFYADPINFNDPLDTSPSVTADMPVADLKEIVRSMVEQRVHAEMIASARAIKYRGPKTLAHIENHSTRQAEKFLAEAEHNATNPDYHVPQDQALNGILTRYIQSELLGRYGKGVFSLGQRFTCPLMWSHYGDEHKGLCLGYSIPDGAQADLHQVKYGGTRLIATSKIAAMLEGDSTARSEVDSAVLLRKAADWKYEREWRHLGPKGLAHSPFELTDITFGIRCENTVKHAVIAALSRRDCKVKFYEMRENAKNFLLKRYRVDESELAASYPFRALSISEAFEDLE